MPDDLTPNSPWRKGKLAQVNARYDGFLAQGYPLADYPGETIQCRNELDRTNWIELRDSCREAFDAGGGEDLIPEPGIRCTSNRYVRPTVNETLNILAWLKAYAWMSQANWWRLKDAVRDAETLAELNGLDLDEGWP